MIKMGKNQINKELAQKAYSKIETEKQELRKELENIKTVYVSYLNQSRTEMDFYYITKDHNSEPTLTRIWINKPYYIDENNKDEYGISEFVDLPYKDKPIGWKKSRSKNGGYCFTAHGYGYSKADHLLENLMYWLGFSSDDIYRDHKMPRIEGLN